MDGRMGCVEGGWMLSYVSFPALANVCLYGCTGQPGHDKDRTGQDRTVQ